MALEDPEHFSLVDVPYLHDTTVGADGQMLSTFGPTYRSHWISLSQIVQLGYFTIACRPDVDAVGETHCKVVVRGPVDKIKVKVVLKSRSVQNFVWDFRNLPRPLTRNYDLIFIKPCQWMMMCHSCSFIKIWYTSVRRSHAHWVVVLGLGELRGSEAGSSHEATTEIHKTYLWCTCTLQKIWQPTKSRWGHTRGLVIVQPKCLLLLRGVLLWVKRRDRSVVSRIWE